MSARLLNYPLLNIFEYSGSHGVSDEAGTITGLFFDVQERLDASFSLGNWREECRHRLCDAWSEASRENWDGYGAEPAQRASVARAFVFIDALPRNIPMPEVAIDPDGEVSFDWFGGFRRQVSVSVSGTGVLSYACLFGSEYVRGKERLQGMLPQHLVACIRRIV